MKEGREGSYNLAATIRYLNKIYMDNSNVYTIFGLYQNYIAYGQRIEKFTDGIYPKKLEKAVLQKLIFYKSDMKQKRFACS